MFKRKSRRDLEWELAEANKKLHEAYAELRKLGKQTEEGCTPGDWCQICKFGVWKYDTNFGIIYHCARSCCDKFEAKESDLK